ncbi:SDR family NAD(P)-dependent oxidoreductase [Methylomarinum sp. Ch1-1]|uniref:SDR family NAD(P)-dependent oxidoreductase n=1 Tax=Methylomarinum roseum TaxID=3067653 RepID=A0AAU7NTZ5_9GAMM|nr:SDR family NAD(P)-dependent oxidoreductase [Methylomarinum sp. Ch1-1]MDP4519449.1 SDR family NAD(P)-dependent oxidoreductase [Methylomarinum sp. Ch1-1]
MQESDGKVFLVTGATGAIGKAIARQVAETKDAEVVLVCRDRHKAERAVQDIARASGNQRVRYELADLSRHDQIRVLAERWAGPLHVLINAAACTPRSRQETPEGVEMQFATNVLGYFRLIDEFSDILRASAPARVVNVASYWAGGLDLDDLEFIRRRYDNDAAYRQSKQADRMLTVAFAEKLAPYQVAVNACHPGDVNSTLSNNLGFGGHESPDQGADTPVWLATDSVGQLNTGRYYEHRRESSCTFGRDKRAVENLYQICASYSDADG